MAGRIMENRIGMMKMMTTKDEARKRELGSINPIPKCPHTNLEFKYTREDWFDGDEDDIYECRDCGERIVEYVPR